VWCVGGLGGFYFLIGTISFKFQFINKLFI
jgi:hypothetical protein